MNTIYSFEVNDMTGKKKELKDFEGKVLLFVNTASKCGLTPQYEGLEALYQKYEDQGLVILGFPCNQFGGQEPGSSDEITEFCQVNYGVSFPMFEKVKVNGKEASPLFVHLKKTLPSIIGGRIKWNFTKFLFDKEGNPVRRFAPTTVPADIEKHIIKLL